MRVDPPLRAEEKVSQAEFTRLALALLQELAADDPSVAEAARERGIPLDEDDQGA